MGRYPFLLSSMSCPDRLTVKSSYNENHVHSVVSIRVVRVQEEKLGGQDLLAMQDVI
jgi:hypothetical protein